MESEEQRVARVAEAARREVELARDVFRERNRHALDLARHAPTPLRAGCNRIDHAVEDLSEALLVMKSGLEAIAEHDCAYGDNCPTFGSRHGRCVGCVARMWLARARDRGSTELRKYVEDKPEAAAFFGDVVERVVLAETRFGPHPSVEFACCRITEEVGELVQAATSNSKGRDINRRAAIREEALDVVAMVLRLLREFPDGRPRDSDGALCTDASCVMCKAGEPCH